MKATPGGIVVMPKIRNGSRSRLPIHIAMIMKANARTSCRNVERIDSWHCLASSVLPLCIAQSGSAQHASDAIDFTIAMSAKQMNDKGPRASNYPIAGVALS